MSSVTVWAWWYNIAGLINKTALAKYNIKVRAILGDQHSASLGHGNISPGDVKHTYGTGCFMMTNVGEQVRVTQDGLLSTVLFQLGKG